MADNGNSVLDGLYALAKSFPNKKNQAKAYILSIIGNVVASASAAWADITDKPTKFPPEDHTHLLADITDYSPGAGTGDMKASTYDPTNVADDAFDYNNFSNTPTIPNSIDDLGPSQAGNAGKFLTTDGTHASWTNLALILVTSISVSAGPSIIEISDVITTSITIS